MTYHEGEIMVQALAGENDRAERLLGAIHTTMPPVAQQFLRTQPLVVASVTDANGRQWARLMLGPLRILDEQSVEVPSDLAGPVGIVVLDPATRRRMRINGKAEGGRLSLTDCYANCPKYIQKREMRRVVSQPSQAVRSVSLSDAQRGRVTLADTFFIATRAPDGGADASHRGGSPGFVQVMDATTLAWRDFAGNSMFNTLGNLAVHPQAGLLFVDFATGDVLSLSGRGVIEWSGTERQVRFTIEEVEDQSDAFPFRAATVEFSPFNPPPYVL